MVVLGFLRRQFLRGNTRRFTYTSDRQFFVWSVLLSEDLDRSTQTKPCSTKTDCLAHVPGHPCHSQLFLFGGGLFVWGREEGGRREEGGWWGGKRRWGVGEVGRSGEEWGGGRSGERGEEDGGERGRGGEGWTSATKLHRSPDPHPFPKHPPNPDSTAARNAAARTPPRSTLKLSRARTWTSLSFPAFPFRRWLPSP